MTTSTAGFFSTGCMSTGMPRPLSVTRDAAVVLQHDVDAGGVARHRLVDGVVHDLLDQVVQTALTGGADVHAGPLADRLETLENGDRRRAVAALLLRHGTCALLALTTSRTRHDRRREACSTGSSGDDPEHASIIPVRPDRNAARTPLSGPQAAERGSGRVATAEKGVQRGCGAVTSRRAPLRRPGERRTASQQSDCVAPLVPPRTPSSGVRSDAGHEGCAVARGRAQRRSELSRRCRGGRGRGRCAGRGASSGRSARPP